MPNHGNCGGCCSHDHEHNPAVDLSNRYSLYMKIDKERLTCLNESIEGAGKCVFKPWDQRLDTETYVESDVDPELLFNIPFTGSVKLKGILLIGGEEDSHPSLMKLFKNRPNMTFDDARSEADETFELHPDPTGSLEYATKAARFNQVHHLSIYFPDNMGHSDSTKVYYIGLYGDYEEYHRHEVTITAYESRANPMDHKTDVIEKTPYIM